MNVRFGFFFLFWLSGGWGKCPVLYVLTQSRLFLEMKVIGEVFTAEQVATGTGDV